MRKRFFSSASASFLSKNAMMASSAGGGGVGGEDIRTYHANLEETRTYSPLPTLPWSDDYNTRI